MTEIQAAELIMLSYRLDQWATLGCAIALVACGWRVGSLFLRERSSIGSQR